MERDKFGCVTCREFKTGGGQLVEFWCPPEDADRVLAALKDIARFEIKIPTTKRVKELEDKPGWRYGEYTRYDITQVKKEGSWLEVLQIHDPPDNRCGNILLAWLSSTDEGRTFFEFDTIENACLAFGELKKSFGRKGREEVLAMPGCLRMAKCRIFKPWFYAVADQAIWGDVVFPDTVKEDEIFRFGEKYIVKDLWNTFTLKTCFSVEHRIYKLDYESKKSSYRRVLWDDGTFTDCWENQIDEWPKPFNESQFWIHEAINKFRELLSGARKKFEILFRDGSKFVGQWKPANPKDKTVAGRYAACLKLENGKKVDGQFDFEPTKEAPTAVDLLNKQAGKKGIKIKEITSLVKKSGGFRGKSWAGVY